MNEVTDNSNVLELKIFGKNMSNDDSSRVSQDLEDRDVFEKVNVFLKTDPSVAADVVVLACSLICAAAVLPEAIKNVQEVIIGIGKKTTELWIEFQGIKVKLDREEKEIVEDIKAILRSNEFDNEENTSE